MSDPIKIDPKQLFTIPGALLISVLVVGGGAGIGWANLQAQTNRIEPLEVRVKEVERALKVVDVMANDIGWIKRQMEEEKRRSSPRE